MDSSRMNRVTEILEAVQSDIEQILLLLKMQEEDNSEIPWGRVWLSKEDLLDLFPNKDHNSFQNGNNCTRTDLDESANEKLKQFIQGFAYRKPNSES